MGQLQHPPFVEEEKETEGTNRQRLRESLPSTPLERDLLLHLDETKKQRERELLYELDRDGGDEMSRRNRLER